MSGQPSENAAAGEHKKRLDSLAARMVSVSPNKSRIVSASAGERDLIQSSAMQPDLLATISHPLLRDGLTYASEMKWDRIAVSSGSGVAKALPEFPEAYFAFQQLQGCSGGERSECLPEPFPSNQRRWGEDCSAEAK
jgi:hypothetical protein